MYNILVILDSFVVSLEHEKIIGSFVHGPKICDSLLAVDIEKAVDGAAKPDRYAVIPSVDLTICGQ